MKSDDILLVVLIVIAVSAIAYSIHCHCRMNRQIKKLDEMLDKAIDGSFIESCFDESQLSYIENKMWKYLSSSEISARKTAEEKAKIKTLIADISHQTKTPVSNILLYSELLSECDLSDTEKDYANRIFSQSEKLSFLIRSLVKLSRLETGIIALSPKKTAIAPMLRDIVIQAQAKADEKGLSLTLECGDEKAVFDEKWTNEAIWNIVDNAIKYTDKGDVKITVKEYEMFVCIEISDTGRGIPESEQAQIFSRFYRSESTSSEEGVGIGLYLARQIVSAENGYIKVVSEVGKGSTFSVFLSKL
ncbi:MAG: HAMP domain-containing histidine kinase [Oscillospiraceae bacterium]|nr:HAMP domain-containing histidine kinase [Oscillospiraceae bacterium]